MRPIATAASATAACGTIEKAIIFPAVDDFQLLFCARPLYLFSPFMQTFSSIIFAQTDLIATFAAEIRHRGGISPILTIKNQNAVMEATMERTVFSPAQVEILNTISQLHSDEDLQELRHWLARFFAMRADRELERLWNEGVITEQTIEDWGKEHMRTPYRSNKFAPA